MSEPSDTTAPPTSEPQGAPKLLLIARMVAVTTPGFISMRRDPEFHGWTADLVRFGERSDLRLLAKALPHIASVISTEDEFGPLFEAVRQHSSEVDLSARLCRQA